MRGMAPHGPCMKAYRTQQVVRITQEGFVVGSENGEARIRQFPVTQGVFDLPKSMDTTVQFDHELELGAQEVSD